MSKLDIDYLILKAGYTRQKLSILNELYLRNTFGSNIEIIDPLVFDACPNLTEFALAFAKLKRIYGNTFKQSVRLTVLNLSIDQIETIDVDAFEGCSKLTDLNLRDNKLIRMKEIYRKVFR